MTAVVTTTIAAAAAAAITTKATAPAGKATSATPTIFARFGFVDFQSAAINFLAIELIDCRCGFFVAGHFDEPEASRTSSVAIFDDARRLNRAGLSKQFLQLLTGSLESEVSHIKFRCHRFNLSLFG